MINLFKWNPLAYLVLQKIVFQQSTMLGQSYLISNWFKFFWKLTLVFRNKIMFCWIMYNFSEVFTKIFKISSISWNWFLPVFFIPGLNLIDSLYLCSVNKIFQKLLLYKRFWTTVTAIQLAILIRNIANIDFFSICYVAALHQTLGYCWRYNITHLMLITAISQFSTLKSLGTS